MVYHRGRAWASIHCWFNVLSRYTNLGICHCLLFHEHGKQNFVQPQVQSLVKEVTIHYTPAWTKLYNEVMSWISGTNECHYAWPLLETNQSTVCDLTIHSVSSHPSSVTVHSRIQRIGPLACSNTCVNFASICSIQIFGIWSAGRTGHTHASCNVISLVWGSLRFAPY